MASKLLNDEFQKHICLDFECTTIEEAIRKAGDLLVQCGCIKPPYIDGMIRREQEHSTHIGFGVMIPHGTEDTLDCVISPGISILKISNGVPYHDTMITMVCLLYTSDAADEEDSVDLGGRRIITKKNKKKEEKIKEIEKNKQDQCKHHE